MSQKENLKELLQVQNKVEKEITLYINTLQSSKACKKCKRVLPTIEFITEYSKICSQCYFF